MTSKDKQPAIRPGYQFLLVLILLLVGYAFYFNWSNTGSFIGHGYSAESIELIEQDIKAEFEKKKGIKVIEVAMVREIPSKLTGFAKIRLRSGKVIYKNCTATLGETGNSLWKCSNK